MTGPDKEQPLKVKHNLIIKVNFNGLCGLIVAPTLFWQIFTFDILIVFMGSIFEIMYHLYVETKTWYWVHDQTNDENEKLKDTSKVSD